MDYKNGKIYAIRSYQTDEIYIGSTCSPLSKRMWHHKDDYKKFINNQKKYVCSSIEILKYEDAYIELIDEIQCKNILELRKHEGNYIRNTDCVNKRIAGRTDKEYYQDNINKIKYNRNKNKEKQQKYWKDYRQVNKQKKLDYEKQYRILNKDKIIKNKKECILCKCGEQSTKTNIARHEKTKKHRTYIFNLHNELNHL